VPDAEKQAPLEGDGLPSLEAKPRRGRGENPGVGGSAALSTPQTPIRNQKRGKLN